MLKEIVKRLDNWNSYSENWWKHKCDIRKVLHKLRYQFFTYQYNN